MYMSQGGPDEIEGTRHDNSVIGCCGGLRIVERLLQRFGNESPGVGAVGDSSRQFSGR